MMFRPSQKGSFFRVADVTIYAGLPLVEGATALGDIYTQLLTLEQKIIDATRQGDNYRSTYLKTLMSDSTVEHFRLIGIQLEVEFTD